MSALITIICFIFVIGISIFIHELGHFLLAKKNGIGVSEFSVGFGPRLFHWQKKETEFSIRLVPFGGFCMLMGDNTLVGRDNEESDLADPEKAFSAHSVWQRLAVIFAGPLFNFILAFLFSLILVGFTGVATSKIGDVMEDYPAGKAGLQAGDEITKLDNTNIHIFNDIQIYMAMHAGESVRVTYERDGETHETVLEPFYSEEDGRYLLGVTSPGRTENLGVFDTIKYSFYTFTYNTGAVLKSLAMLVTGKLSLNALSGPVGVGEAIYDIVEDVGEDTQGENFFVRFYWLLMNMVSFIVLLSANLGVMNLLPLPGLDGGRLLFLFIELILRKPIDKKKEGIVTFIGIMLLLILMVIIFFNDIRKIFMGI